MNKPCAERQEQIARYVYDNGPQTVEHLQRQFKDISHSSVIETVISNMVTTGKLCVIGYQYDVTQSMADYFSGRDNPKKYQGEIVPPRTYEFKPLSQKYFISAQGTRDTAPPRDFHPVVLASNVPASVASYD